MSSTDRYISDTDITAAQIKLLYETSVLRYSNSRERIRQSREMLAGNLRIEMPEEIEDKNKQHLAVRLPQGTTIPLKTVNVLQRKRPKVRRYPIGKSQQAEDDANAVERFMNAWGEQAIDWDTLVDWLFNESETAMLTLPTDAHYERVPSLFDIAEDGSKTIRPIYQRDKAGKRRKAGDDKFKPDDKKSTAAWEEILDDYRAKNPLVQCRLINATDCAAIWGNNDQLEGLVIKELYGRQELIKRNFKWNGMDDLLEPADQSEAAAPTRSQVTLYTYVGLNDEGQPFVAYSVEGKSTKFKAPTVEDPDRQADAKINLYEQYGLSRIPIKYGYGWHFRTKNPDMRGVPFIWPFIPSLLGTDALATATVTHAWNHAFGGWFSEVNPALDPKAWLDEGQPRPVKVKQMGVTYVPGPIKPAVHQGVNKDVMQMIQLMMGAVEQEIPGGGGGAFGAAGASSGHDRSLMRAYLEDSVSQVLKSALEMYEFACEIALEIFCHLAEQHDMPIPLYVNVDKGAAPTSVKATLRELVVLEPGMAGVNYDLEAFYPRQHGENLAQAQQLAEFVKQKLATFDEFRRLGFGDENPGETRILIAVDELIFETPVGRQYVMERAMEILGEEKMKEMLQLQAQGMMTAGGTPTAALDGLFPGQAGGGTAPGGGNPGNVMSGVGGIATGRQALGGAVSGGMQTAATQNDAAVQARTQSGQGYVR